MPASAAGILFGSETLAESAARCSATAVVSVSAAGLLFGSKTLSESCPLLGEAMLLLEAAMVVVVVCITGLVVLACLKAMLEWLLCVQSIN